MAETFTVQCDQALPNAPEWVQLVPLGNILARDGRRFVVDDPALIIASFEAGAIDLPIDYEHQNDNPKAKLSGPVPAAGWVKELASRDDGIWGRVEWTDRARSLISAREYRFLSPSILVEKRTGRVSRIKGAGLVHNPALHITALASEENTMSDPSLVARFATLLGLDETATEEEVFEALKSFLQQEQKPDPRKYAPVETLQEVMNDRNQELATLREEQARAKEDRIQAKVEEACQAGYLTGPGRDWALELCRKDEAAFDGFVDNTKPAYAHLLKPLVSSGKPPGRDQTPDISAEVQLLSEQLGVTPERLTSD